MHFNISQLKNGLTVITCPMSQIKSVSLGIWVKSGSRNEKEHEHGIAHLLEHMAFKGTKTRCPFKIATDVENIGGEINAATSIETTSYFIRLLGQDLSLGIDILSDILLNSVYNEKELEREKQVILQEISAAHDAPDDIIFDYFSETAFQNQTIGRPILGTKESVNSFQRDDIKTFLQEHYSPQNMLVIAAGAVEHDELCQHTEKTLGQFINKTKPSSLSPAHYTGGDYREERDIMDTHVLLGFEGIPYQKDAFYAAQILSIILGGGMSSRLFQQIREKRGLCYSIYAFHWGFSDTGLFGIHAATSPELLKDLMHVIVDELHSIINNIDYHEMHRAITQYRAGLIMSQETAPGVVQTAARQYMLTGRIIKDEEIFAQLDALTPEYIQSIAKRIFLEKKPTLTAIGSVKELISYDNLLKLLAK